MFQKFDAISAPETAKQRIADLRACFDEHQIDAYLVPKGDEYLGEYIPAYAERLAFLTSFTGSAGSVLVLKDKAVVFTDGRYTSQVVKQCDNDVFEFADSVSNPPEKWIKSEDLSGLRLGLDPWLFPGSYIKRITQTLDELGGALTYPDKNLVDLVWTDQPEKPNQPAFIQPLTLAG